MQNQYRISFGTYFLTCAIHLLMASLFFLAKPVDNLRHKPIIVKSFSAPSENLVSVKSLPSEVKPKVQEAAVKENPPIEIQQEPAPKEAPVEVKPKPVETKQKEEKAPPPKEEPAPATPKPVPKPKEVEKVVQKKKEAPGIKVNPKPVVKKKTPPKLASSSKPAALKQKERISRKEEKQRIVPPYQREKTSALVQELEKKIASFNGPVVARRSNARKEIDVPKMIQGLSIDAKIESSAAGASSFQDLLIQDLKNNLQLPEYGEVRARIRISSKGEVLQMEVLSSQSEKNKIYLRQEVMKMQFSWFSTIPSSAAFFDFIITFENEKS